jgi:WD40 repeat protein/serine/threonine protein kinase
VAEGFLAVTCPGCGATTRRVPAHLAGRKIRCTRCRAVFTAPAPPAGEEAAPTVLEAAAPSSPVEAGAEAPTRPEAGALSPTVAEGTAAAAPAGAGTARAAAVDWSVGDVVLGLYEVAGVLGQGGMGRVYRVRHRGWGLDLAVKAPLPEVLEAAGGADLFQQEAETWVNLGLHPHVVTCHYVRRAFDLPLVFAELVDGGSLLDWIRGGRLASLEAILDVAVQAAWGLHYAHEQGLVHRDVKPANVLLGADGTAKVTDFGLARARTTGASAPIAPGAGDGHTMTVEGGGAGTPAYLSPEQAAGEALTRRSDLWSFALTVLEMFVGARTWDLGLAAPEVLEQYRHGGPARPGRPPMPDEVATLLGECFRERPEERPRSLAHVAAALRAAWERAAGRPYPRREPRGGRGSPDGLNNRAVSLVDLGRAAEADTLWRRALEAEPQHVEATYNASLTAWTGGSLDDTALVRRMEEACTSHAAEARAHQLLGRLHRLLGNALEADASFSRARQRGGSNDLDRDEAAPSGASPNPRLVLRGLPGPVSALVQAADGHTTIAAGGDEVRVWDAGSGTLLKTMTGAEGEVHALLPLPGGRFLLVAAEKGPLAVWDLLSGQRVRSWTRHPGVATSLALVPGGRLVVSGASDRVVRLWDAASGKCVREMAGHEDAVTTVAASETFVVSGARDGTVCLWEVAEGRPVATLRGHEGRVHAVVVSEADARVVSAGEDRTLRDWGLHSHQLVRSYVSHAGAAHALAFAAGGKRLLSGGADRTVRVWNLDEGRLVERQTVDAAVHALVVAPDGAVWAAHGTAVSALAPAPVRRPPPVLCRPSSAIEVETRAESFAERIEEARRTLSTGDFTRAVSLVRTARRIPGHERSTPALAVWDELCARLPRRALQSAWEEAPLTGHGETPVAVAVAPDGVRALSGGLDATLRVWDLESRGAESVLSGHDGAITSAAFAGDGARGVSGGRDRTVRLWDLDGGRLLATLEGHGETVSAVDASPDGRRAASASWDGTVRLWDLGTGATLHVLEGHGAQVTAVRWAADGQAVASAGWDGAVRLWEAGSGAPVCVLEGHEGNVTALALPPQARSVASGGEDGTVRLWDPRTRRAVRTLAGHESEVTGLAFTVDGRFLVSSARDRTVRVWDVRRGLEVRTLPHRATVHAVALNSLGNLLLAGVADRSVHAWHLDWEPEAEAVPATGGLVTATRAGPGPVVAPEGVAAAATTVRPTAGTVAPRRPQPTYWDGLRRDQPRIPRAVPRAAGAVRRVPWGRAALAAGGLAAVAVGVASWWKPAPRIALSPYMQQAVPAEIDLVDRKPFASGCDPSDYRLHLDHLDSGSPSARDIACLAALSSAGTVADVLDGAPLVDPEPIQMTRLRRNAASVLAGLDTPAFATLCARLDDPRGEVRRVVAFALSGAQAKEEAARCVRDTLLSGSSRARAAAVLPFRQLLAHGVLAPEEGWSLVQGLLADGDAQTRIAGLQALPMFRAHFSEPAARALLDDGDPAVAEAARSALGAIEGAHRTDLLAGHGDP